MARKPNYQFERSQRERIKEAKLAEKAAEKRALREAADRLPAQADSAETSSETD